ncbi:pullulanase-type alpha-1,6-glucosidase [Salinivibrio costicola]|uniref:pullulanase-type alpha-1,6-glucosidase n=1 Tax=Salinivibrio costicola TaxID=51367 RepID=UPI003F705AB8
MNYPLKKHPLALPFTIASAIVLTGCQLNDDNPNVDTSPTPSARDAGTSDASVLFADADTLLTHQTNATSLTLYYSADGTMRYNPDTQQVENATASVESTLATRDNWQASFLHLQGNVKGFDFDFVSANVALKQWLKGQLLAIAKEGDTVLTATDVQPARALDALYAEHAEKLTYGAIPDAGHTEFRLWAPTAQQVSLVPYQAASEEGAPKQRQTPIKMDFDAESGSWHVATTALNHGDYYRYQLSVYHPATHRIERLEVTDPYSHSLSTNSSYSQVVDLNASALKPSGWDTLSAPHSQQNPANGVIYEAHVRDFSALDQSTPQNLRGKYLAFTQNTTEPVKHVTALAQSGVTHLHLLPVFDIASINEDAAQRIDVIDRFSALCDKAPSLKDTPRLASECDNNQTIQAALTDLAAQDSADTPYVQTVMAAMRQYDSFNWGYDPFHYTVPEGSYATEPEGTARILEFRKMIMAIKQNIGMNVVMDVVYNHTHQAGLGPYSVLDKVVPWYYQRLNPVTGDVEQSTCCSNTAPEHRMFAKLIDDSIATWVKDYKIDAFRWDLMGHHPLAQIEHTLAVARGINPDVYFYGEGWNFGEVANDRQFVQATQANLAGTGIGSFSDRLRDAVRGGGPFDGGEYLRKNQGFGNGQWVAPNDLQQQNSGERASALHNADLVRLGMAGNLKDFQLQIANGDVVRGDEVDYNGQPAGYAQDAWEVQNYVSKHDNQTLWDNNQYKFPYAMPLETRVRAQAVSLSTALLGQGVPFIHMGSELLRSKSMQRDSYDSGDWYNRVDFTQQTTQWDQGLPREDKDGYNWPTIETVIANHNSEAKPTPQAISNMDSYFNELVALRTSSGLFHLGQGSVINQRVSFHNTGSSQIPGLIVMQLDNSGSLHDSTIDATRDGVIVAINASGAAVNTFDNINATGYQLHSLQANAGNGSIAYNQQAAHVTNGKLTVPSWSVAVFEKPHQP